MKSDRHILICDWCHIENHTNWWTCLNEFQFAFLYSLKHLRTKKDSDSISDKEHAQGVTQRAEFKKKEIDLNSSFILDCFDILDAKRAIAIPEIKKNFRKEILAKRNNTVKEK